MQLSQKPWLVVAGSTLALTVGNGPIMQFTFGVFLKPLTAQFGIDRATGSLALTIGLLATAATLPFMGRLADKFGPRNTGLVAVILFALGVAAAGQLSQNIWTFMVLFALAGVAAAGQTPLPYFKAIAARFDKHRGLALSIGLTGVGIGSIILPKVAQYILDRSDWRGGYLGLAIILVAVAIPALLLFIPNDLPPKKDEPAAAAAPGMTVSEAARTRPFWLLLLALFLAAAAANGTIAHVNPLLTDRGVPANEAVNALAVVGFASIVGRLLGGYLIDRVWAPLISLIFLVGMAGGVAILLFAQTVGMASIATILIGVGLGVEADMVGFMITRYLGIKSFGALFGMVFGIFILASSLGPIFMGKVFDMNGDYKFGLGVFIGFLAVSALAFLSMGKYVYPATQGAPQAH